MLCQLLCFLYQSFHGYTPVAAPQTGTNTVGTMLITALRNLQESKMAS